MNVHDEAGFGRWLRQAEEILAEFFNKRDAQKALDMAVLTLDFVKRKLKE